MSPAAGTAPRPAARPATDLDVERAPAVPAIPPPVPSRPEGSAKLKWAIGAAVAAALLGSIGLLVWLKANKVDPQKVKASLKAEMEAINSLPADRIEDKEERAHLLVENETYEKYGAEVYRSLLRSHDALHAEAQAYRRSQEKAKGFLTRHEFLKTDPKRMAKEAGKLLDESRPLIEAAAGTPMGPRLEAAAKELESFVAARAGTGWEVEFVEVRRKADGAAAAGDFAGALDIARAFGEKRREGDDRDLARKLGELRDSIRKKGEARIDSLIAKARKLVDDGRAADAASLVKPALPGLRGFSRIWELERLLEGK